jgi:hypothetical protein
MGSHHIRDVRGVSAYTPTATKMLQCRDCPLRAVAELVGNEGGVVSGVFNLESSDVEASDWRPRHDKHYHEA